MKKEIHDTLNSGDTRKIRALFAFSKADNPELILLKFKIWGRWFFPRFFKSKDASYHEDVDMRRVKLYVGIDEEFLDMEYRGSAKTTRSKVFLAFCIANDIEHFRKYIKINSKEIDNSKQTTTDVYNMLVSKRIKVLYPEVFEKTDTKREERMASFTTATGIKMVADTIGTDQRGDIQEESRPDFQWFDDFETSLSLMSAVTTNKIWVNMEEAKNGKAKGGASLYTCNYISERGNVHKLALKVKNQVNIPIGNKVDGIWIPTWPNRYTAEDILKLEQDAEDFAGEYLGKPSIGKDVYFVRESVDRQVSKELIDEVSGLKIFRKYDPSNRVCSGHDVGGGVGVDSSTSVFLDLDVFPIQVIATYKDNEIKPDAFAHEIVRQCKRFGENYVAVEKNYGSTLDILKTIYPTDMIHKTHTSKPKIVFQQVTEYGFETNAATKPMILSTLNQAIESGLIELNDADLIAEVRSYTTGDLMD